MESATDTGKPAVAEDGIAGRAFEPHVERGRTDGHDADGWLDAERELRDAANSSAA